MHITNQKLTRQELSHDQYDELHMHSFLNILNIISMQIDILLGNVENGNILQQVLDETSQLSKRIKGKELSVFKPKEMQRFQEKIWYAIDRIDLTEGPESNQVLIETRSVLNEIFRVLDIRSEELVRRLEKPTEWEQFTIDEFKAEFKRFFHAIEKNSKGRYRIIYNIAKQEGNDYLVQFEVDSDEEGLIRMPLLFKDVMRDLIANARKYTNPGGQIDIGVYYREKILRFVVQDNGIGIPENELLKVFEYGYRASNARNRRTMGGGYGLTKAIYVTRHFNGELWIDSKEEKGTWIYIELPVKPAIENNQTVRFQKVKTA